MLLPDRPINFLRVINTNSFYWIILKLSCKTWFVATDHVNSLPPRAMRSPLNYPASRVTVRV